MGDELTMRFYRLSCALALSGVLLMAAPHLSAQEQQPPPPQPTPATEDAQAAPPTTVTKEKSPPVVMPVFTDYKGVTIGMSAVDVRAKLENLKQKTKTQDFYAITDAETAQVYYDGKGLVSAISINYIGTESGAPDALAILGQDILPNDKGVVYKLVRYPAAKYWVSYSRTAGDSPITTVTIKKMR